MHRVFSPLLQPLRTRASRALVLGLLTCALLFAQSSRSDAEEVTVWVYHNFPPFIVNEGTQEGLSFDLARLLTRGSEGRLTFQVQVLPRKRLNQRLAAGRPGIVLWANSAWFGDRPETRYRWTRRLISDSNVVISPATAPVDYAGPHSLSGMTITGIRGHRYPGIDMLVEAGYITRINFNTEGQLVRFIGSGRGGAAIIARSAAQYFTRTFGLEDDIHFASQPHSSYERRILVQPQLGNVHTYIERILSDADANRRWRQLVEGYGLSH
ncbi:MAG: hypothetical protein AAFY59_18995 [Pseudomonadota bacterium]